MPGSQNFTWKPHTYSPQLQLVNAKRYNATRRLRAWISDIIGTQSAALVSVFRHWRRPPLDLSHSQPPSSSSSSSAAAAIMVVSFAHLPSLNVAAVFQAFWGENFVSENAYFMLSFSDPLEKPLDGFVWNLRTRPSQSGPTSCHIWRQTAFGRFYGDSFNKKRGKTSIL